MSQPYLFFIIVFVRDYLSIFFINRTYLSQQIHIKNDYITLFNIYYNDNYYLHFETK